MGEEKKYSILGELAKCSGFSIALMTTFNFEIRFFERAVLNLLLAKDVKKISLFVDSGELTSALNSFDIHHNGSHIGRKYMVNPVEMKGAFHPKLILLLGEKKARLFVGSANIKSSGYAINNEIFNFIDYSPDHPEYLDVIVAAINFFQTINDMSYKLDNEVIKEAKEFIYYHRASANGELHLLNNTKTDFLTQISALITEKVTSIDVAVPYYDKELAALQALKDRFPKAKTHLFIQNKLSTFPIDYNKENHVVEHITTFSGFRSNSGSVGIFYHGKVFRFNTENNSFVLYGSANCTQSALTKATCEGGNVECGFFEKGGLNEFDDFFDSIVEDESEKFTSQPMVFEKEKPDVFVYRYGVAKRILELHISYTKRIEDLMITVGSQKLEYSYSNTELIVSIPEELRGMLSDIFEISICYGDKEEILRCWTYSAITLANNRAYRGNDDDLSYFDVNATGDKYLQDRIRVLKADATCLSDLQEQKDVQKYINQIKQEQEGEDGEAEDYIIDFEIPDEYRYAYKQYKNVERIRGIFLQRFFGAYSTRETEQNQVSISLKNTDETVADETPKRRKATSEEKSFENFIKGKVRGMLNDLFVKAVELDHYVSLVQVIIEIFDKYRKQENVEDIFLPDYVVTTKIQFLGKILSKRIETGIKNEEFDGTLICMSFDAILEDYLFLRRLDDQEEAKRYEFLGKNLLIRLEKYYNLRQIYPTYIKKLIRVGTRNALTLGNDASCRYIDELYGYKDYDMLVQYITERYSGAKVYIKGSTLNIDYQTQNIRACLRPDTDVLKEISRYSRNVSRLKYVMISIQSIDGSFDHLESIVHTINIDYNQWKYAEKGRDGMVFTSKTQFIGF